MASSYFKNYIQTPTFLFSNSEKLFKAVTTKLPLNQNTSNKR